MGGDAILVYYPTARWMGRSNFRRRAQGVRLLIVNPHQAFPGANRPRPHVAQWGCFSLQKVLRLSILSGSGCKAISSDFGAFITRVEVPYRTAMSSGANTEWYRCSIRLAINAKSADPERVQSFV